MAGSVADADDPDAASRRAVGVGLVADGSLLMWDNEVGLVSVRNGVIRTVVAQGDRVPVYDLAKGDDGTGAAAQWADQIVARYSADGALLGETALTFKPRSVAFEANGASSSYAPTGR